MLHLRRVCAIGYFGVLNSLGLWQVLSALGDARNRDIHCGIHDSVALRPFGRIGCNLLTTKRVGVRHL
jgi:hypothetical protein